MALIAVLVAFQVTVVLGAGGDWMHFHRFFVPVFPLMISASVAGGYALFKALAGGKGLMENQKIALVMAFGLVVGVEMTGVYKEERMVQRMVFPHLDEGGYLTQVYGEVGAWVQENSAEDWRIAVSDIGAIGYFSQRYIIDMFGLTNRHIARAEGRQHWKSDVDYVLAQKPEIILLVSKENGGFLRIPDQRMASSSDFTSLYRLIKKFPISFRQETVEVFRRKETEKKSHRLDVEKTKNHPE
jgi:hypothetical protein